MSSVFLFLELDGAEEDAEVVEVEVVDVEVEEVVVSMMVSASAFPLASAASFMAFPWAFPHSGQ